jgi:nicotinate-nucleotide adenylyltransferase
VRVALLGGSFNPPHVGHLMAAYWTLATQPVDRVWLMPVFEHPFHKVLAPFEHRMRMCELAAEELKNVEVTRVEAEVGREGWTYQTLEYLREKRPDLELSLVVGSDLMLERDKWRRFDRVIELARLIVIHRAGYDVPEAPGPVLAELSSTVVRQKLGRGEDVSLWVPQRVAAYAREHHLYGPA